MKYFLTVVLAMSSCTTAMVATKTQGESPNCHGASLKFEYQQAVWKEAVAYAKFREREQSIESADGQAWIRATIETWYISNKLWPHIHNHCRP